MLRPRSETEDIWMQVVSQMEEEPCKKIQRGVITVSEMVEMSVAGGGLCEGEEEVARGEYG